MKIAKFSPTKMVTFSMVLLVFIFISTGCNRANFSLLHDRDQIQSIYLIDYSMIDTTDLSVLPEDSVPIENVDAFLNDLEKLDFVNFILGDPVLEQTLGIYILYSNGDVEIIYYLTQLYSSQGTVAYRNIQCNFNDYNNLVRSYYDKSTGQ
ncbi:MAG: hypothetical protein E7581_05880 [Ruminococcaceae bacterium]|nr:hypothetical protein [Oscillospiraceae bacterium]